MLMLGVERLRRSDSAHQQGGCGFGMWLTSERQDERAEATEEFPNVENGECDKHNRKRRSDDAYDFCAVKG